MSKADRDTRRAQLEAELAEGCTPDALRVILVPGKGCTFEDNWYIDLARKLKGFGRGRLLCSFLAAAHDVD